MENPTIPINAVFTYAVDTGEKIVNETMGYGDMGRKRTGVVEEKTMAVHDGRRIRDAFNLEAHGFEFVDHKTKMTNFYDEIPGLYSSLNMTIMHYQTSQMYW